MNEAPEGYEVVRELGSGPFGRALLCRKAGETAVVRILGVTGESAAALEAELRALAVAAEHPCAVAFSRVWTDPALGVCIEQPYCVGGALDSSPSAPADAAVLATGGVRLAAALAHSHRLGILHGEVCPANVLMDAGGNWLLADGGLTQALRHASRDLAVEPDPVFAPRELQGWEAPAEAADVYSLGATLCSQLLGSDDSAGFVAALANDASGLGSLLIRMLAPNPADRPSLVEVDEMLRAHVSAETRAALPAAPPGPRPASALPRPTMRLLVTEPDAIVRSGRRRTYVAAAAIGAVFLAGAGAVAVSNSGDDGAATVAQVSTSAETTVADLRALVPIDVRVRPDLWEGRWRWYVSWQMPALPDPVTGWRIGFVDPKTGRTERFGTRLVSEAGRKTPVEKMVWAFRHVENLPLSFCARIVTEADGALSPPTKVVCPDPVEAKKREAENAKALKATKDTPKPTPKKATPKPVAKKKVRET